MSLLFTSSKHQLYTQSLNQTILKLDSTAVIDTPYRIFNSNPRGGSVITAITVVTDDVAGRVLTIHEEVNGTPYVKDSWALPISTPYGTDGTTRELNLISNMVGTKVDAAGNKSYFLAPGKTLYASVDVAITDTKYLLIKVYGEDY